MVNPLRDELAGARSAQPCVLVIFGATGDLTQRKLVPALAGLQRDGLLPSSFAVVGFARRPKSDEQFRTELAEGVRMHGREGAASAFTDLAPRIHYHRADFSDESGYGALRQRLAALDQQLGTRGNRLFYLATPPSSYSEILAQLAASGLSAEQDGFARVVVEKPFGHDLESAHALNAQVNAAFRERQVFRIDHYLGKETVQNILALRFANGIFEPLWNERYVDHVQITVAESTGIGTRAGYYDRTGAMRDMLQNHLMQLLTLVAMEPPAALEPESLRDEKVKVLRSIRPIPRRLLSTHAFRAQYAAGSVSGKPVPAYREEEGVEPGSITETYVAARFLIDNWRWRGVPFYLRTGKRLHQSQSHVAIRFKHPPQQLFRETPLEDTAPNWIILGLQPRESMGMEIQARQPGLSLNTRTIRMDASYRGEGLRTVDAYEALLLDIVRGDQTNFIRFDEVEWAWRVVDPILRAWAQEREHIHTYPAGSWGPAESNRLFEWDYQAWRDDA